MKWHFAASSSLPDIDWAQTQLTKLQNLTPSKVVPIKTYPILTKYAWEKYKSSEYLCTLDVCKLLVCLTCWVTSDLPSMPCLWKLSTQFDKNTVGKVSWGAQLNTDPDKAKCKQETNENKNVNGTWKWLYSLHFIDITLRSNFV